MIIHNPILTGSFTVNGTDVASITSSAASITAINSYTASQNILNGTYATTGSNTFKNPQTINSNLIVTGSITAATLVVQTITSSVVYSSGSNVFGNNIANTQVMTGSVLVTGSITSNGSVIINGLLNVGSGSVSSAAVNINSNNSTAAYLYFNGAGVTNNYTAITGLEGATSNLKFYTANTLRLTIDSAGAATFSSSVAINGAAGNAPLHVLGANQTNGTAQLEPNSAKGTYSSYIHYGTTGDWYIRSASATGKVIINDTGGNVGIGTSSPRGLLQLFGAEVSAYKTYTGQGNTGGGDTIINAYRLDSASAYLRVTDIVALGDDTNNRGSTIRLMTTNTSGATSAAMTITSGGNVVIGNTTGDGKFYVKTASAVSYSASGYNGSNANIRLETGGTAATNVTTGISMGVGGSAEAYIGAVQNSSTYADIVFQNYNGSYNERMRITSGGNILIGGTTDNGYRLDVRGGQTIFNFTNASVVAMQRLTTDGQILNFFKDSTLVGSISTNSNSLPSDLNFKKNINNLELGLNLVTKLRAVSYNHKIDDNDAALSTGFIAQELESSLTELGVKENKYYILQHIPSEKEGESQYWLDYTKMIPVLVKAIQEQQALIKSLQAQITELKNK